MRVRGSLALVASPSRSLSCSPRRCPPDTGGPPLARCTGQEQPRRCAERLWKADQRGCQLRRCATGPSAATGAASPPPLLTPPRPDALHSAGVAPAVRVLHKKKGVHPLSIFEQTMKVNTVGSFNVLRLAAEAMSTNEVRPPLHPRAAPLQRNKSPAREARRAEARLPWPREQHNSTTHTPLTVALLTPRWRAPTRAAASSSTLPALRATRAKLGRLPTPPAKVGREKKRGGEGGWNEAVTG